MAASLSEFTTKQDILDILGVLRWLTLRDCHLRVGQVHHPGDDLIQVQAGDSIVVEISPQPPSSRSRGRHQEADDSSLMQFNAGNQNPSVGVDLPPNTGDQECSTFRLNPHAAPFQPGTIAPADMSEFQEDLWQRWNTEAFAWENEDRSCTI